MEIFRGDLPDLFSSVMPEIADVQMQASGGKNGPETNRRTKTPGKQDPRINKPKQPQKIRQQPLRK